MYILEAFQGRGIGRELIKTLFSKFEHLGCNTIFMEVLEDNESRYFYEAFGAELYKSERVKIAGLEAILKSVSL
ncbi:GNAT family N-acetyltransferase [Peribacillus sp. SCS-155]|uniref:GNAT family N-acetyltransferase n=1 Tax=Peribacillus sedimenti TaxID=3115297 RepID=UPI0039058FF0